METSRIVAPVFLFAAPYSGAGLLFQRLSTMPDFSPLAEWPQECGDAELEEVLYRKLHHQAQRLLVHDERIVSRLPELAARFPDARFVWVYREPAAAIAEMIGNGTLASDAARVWSETTSTILHALDQLERNRWFAARYEFLHLQDGEIQHLWEFLRLAIPRSILVSATRKGVLEPELDPLTAAIDDRARAKLLQARAVVPEPPSQVPFADPFRSVSSDYFPELLHELGISLIVTTYQAGKVVLVRASDRTTLHTDVRHLPNPMGVATGPNVLVIGTKREILQYYNDPPKTAQCDPQSVNDALLLPLMYTNNNNNL